MVRVSRTASAVWVASAAKPGASARRIHGAATTPTRVVTLRASSERQGHDRVTQEAQQAAQQGRRADAAERADDLALDAHASAEAVAAPSEGHAPRFPLAMPDTMRHNRPGPRAPEGGTSAWGTR